ncbi:flippase-like domain-containing protein [Candidatus Woesearchaeota archaeon]|nr:flippase-like domain-containing protein [Candidatus Woesearchaeota archaeon]
MRKAIEFLAKAAVATALLLYLFYQIGVQQIVNVLPRLELLYFMLFGAVFFASLFLGVINIKLLLDGLGYRLPFKKIAQYYITSWSLGLYAPGKLGEFSLVYLLKREKIGMGQSMAISVIDKVITFIVFGTAAVTGFIVFLTFIESLWLLSLLMLGLAAALYFLLSETGRAILKKYILRRFAAKFSGFNTTMRLFLKEKKKVLIYNVILTVVKLHLMALSISLLFISFGTHVSFFYTLLIIAIGTIIALIPVTFSGLGVREAASVYLFSKLGVDPAVTLTVFLVALITNFMVSALFVLLVLKRMKLYDEMREAKEMLR